MGSHLLATEPATMKAFISLALLAASYASDPYGPPAPYAPAPAYAPVPVVHAAPAYHAPAPVVHAPAYHAPAPAYHAAPHPAPYHEETPKNYQFGYDVHGYDEYGNPNVHSRTEQRDGYNVKGQYRVELPDCRTQIVDYFVDEYKQYHADVKYEGEICPDKSLIKHAKDPYHPAPAPYHAPAPAPYHAPAPAPYHAPAPVVHAPVAHVAHAPIAHAPVVHAPVVPAHVATPFVHHG